MRCLLLCETLVLVLFLVSSSVFGKGFSDKSILLEFKASISDPAGILASWDSNDSDYCSWFGVSCDSNSRVSSLRIDGGDGERGNYKVPFCSVFPFSGFGIRRTCSPLHSERKLVGSLLGRIGELTELRVLSITHHDFSGEIPVEIWGLKKLEVLVLERNRFTGKLPDRITGLKNLRVLNVAFNEIDGEIPSSLSKCSNLRVLNLAGNRINGTIPRFFGSFSKVRGLYLSGNWLGGYLRADIGFGCRNLEHLDVSRNFLNGRIPSSLGNCWQLKTLLLFSNVFDGVIPPEFGRLHKLEILDVSRNNLFGPVPVELGNCVGLSVVVLKNIFDPPSNYGDSSRDSLVEPSVTPRDDTNYFGGSLPINITSLPKLQIMWAPGASFQGKLPENWGACESLEMVNLAQNHFSGKMDGVFGGCKNLHFLDLSSNRLTGHIDESIPVPCMNHFDISRNLLSGKIPRFNHSICPPIRFSILDLVQTSKPPFTYQMFFINNARLRSTLPFSDARYTILHNFGENNFSGSIQWLPIAEERLGKQTDYAFLAGGNKHAGLFPKSLFGKCDELNGMIVNVSNNEIYGHIPSDIGITCRSLRFLDLSMNQISGPIPQSIGDLESLVVLDLSENKLHGQIPAEFSRLKVLRHLSLVGNNLTGGISSSSGQWHSLEILELRANSLSQETPQNLLKLRNPTDLLKNNELPKKISSFLANRRSLSDDSEEDSQNEAASPPGNDGNTDRSGYNSIEIASIASASAIVSVLLALVVLLIYTRKWTPKSRVQICESREITIFTEIGVPLTFDNIVQATGNFNANNCIGNGGFGVTYKAEVAPGTLVAVKRLSVGRFHGVQQFHAEIKTLGTVRHPNLVTLVGYHASETEMFLIYNYLPGGNLENFIKERSAKAIDWKILHKIALDIARALAYLHDQCDPRVVHRDVKPSNILLDNEWNAYLSDFGLSRLLGTSETHATTGVAGTFGYLAPEYAMTCRVSEKADVYSYGVVLLELISDKKALDPSFSSQGNGFNIVTWACMMMRQGKAKVVFTSGLWETGFHDALVETLHLAIMCTVDSLSIRPTMKQVSRRLKQIQQLGIQD